MHVLDQGRSFDTSEVLFLKEHWLYLEEFDLIEQFNSDIKSFSILLYVYFNIRRNLQEVLAY